MGTMAHVRVNTSQSMILYRDFVIQETDAGWQWDHNDDDVSGNCTSVFACIDAIDNWHDNAAESAWVTQQETLMESGGPDDSAYRKAMAEAEGRMMESILKEACDAHGLRAIGVNMFDAKTGHITVYIHSGESECHSGTGKSFIEALSCAVAEMKEQHDNAAESAWVTQQETLMESGGPDDSAYRKAMAEAGRSHLLKS